VKINKQKHVKAKHKFVSTLPARRSIEVFLTAKYLGYWKASLSSLRQHTNYTVIFNYSGISIIIVSY